MATLLSDRPGLTVFDSEPAGAEVDRRVSVTAVSDIGVTSMHRSDALVWGADLTGLAVALSRTLEAPTLIAIADGETATGPTVQPVRFPEPVGTREASLRPSPLEGVPLLAAGGTEPWCALRITGERTLALVDDRDFVAAVILGAAARLPPGPVWNHHEAFLADATKLGLRFAQAVV